jgi:hypothetical protein
MSKIIVIRITRHAADAARVNALKSAFGEGVVIVDRDIPYGIDPVAAVTQLIESVKAEVGGTVVAVEAQAPLSVLIKLVQQRSEIGAKLIRTQFERDATGRAVVVGKDESGRDLLKFSHYEEFVRIEFEMVPLSVVQPL